MVGKLAKDYLIVALDTSSEKEAIQLVDSLKEHASFFKVGLELFTSVGPEIIKIIKNTGNKVFFDGKFLDIPNTVSKAISNMVYHKVDILNIHMSGGVNMITEAKNALVETAQKYNLQAPKLLGVSVLTSISSETLHNDLQVRTQINEYVRHLATLAIKNNLDGIICSPQEAKQINKIKIEHTNKNFLIVTPGVRPKWAANDDQERIATPKEAILNGATHIVIGRPITQAKDPKDAVTKVLGEIEEALVMLHPK